MQAALTLVTLLSLYKLGTIQAAPVSSGAVDLTDPQILREDIDDLRWEMENGYQRLLWSSRTRSDNMQTELATLENTVTTLQERISELENWRAQTETLMKNVPQELREQILEAHGKIDELNNHANLLDDVVLQHHPESNIDLGYPMKEDATAKTNAPHEPAGP